MPTIFLSKSTFVCKTACQQNPKLEKSRQFLATQKKKGNEPIIKREQWCECWTCLVRIGPDAVDVYVESGRHETREN